MILTKLLAFAFDNPLGRLAAGALGLAVLVGAFAAQQRNIGAAKAVAKIEKATIHAVQTGSAGAAGSRDVRVRGVRDPSTRD